MVKKPSYATVPLRLFFVLGYNFFTTFIRCSFSLFPVFLKTPILFNVQPSFRILAERMGCVKFRGPVSKPCLAGPADPYFPPADPGAFHSFFLPHIFIVEGGRILKGTGS